MTSHAPSTPTSSDTLIPMSGSSDDLIPVPIDIDKSQWDQSHFLGRLNRFARITNPFLLLKSRKELDRSAELVKKAREGYVPRGTTVAQLRAAKVLYDSAFHPDSGDKMNAMGRMSAQVPAGMVITGILMAYYKTPMEAFLSQWGNQSFNALVNYTNRNAKSTITSKQLGMAYVSATTGAVAVSIGMNSMVQRAPPVVRRWVPFMAVASANCINIPVMRQRELIDGMTVTDDEGNTVGKSRLAAAKGIAQVCFSRIFMAAPGMLLIPVLMERLEKYPFFNRGKMFSAVVQTLLCGVGLIFTVPIGCALFPQRSSMHSNHLERSVLDEMKSNGIPLPEKVYFNKGL